MATILGFLILGLFVYLGLRPALRRAAYERGWQDAMRQEHPPEARP